MCRSGVAATQVDLARMPHIHPMQVSLMLKALEAKVIVGRRGSATDTHSRKVEITGAGPQAIQAFFPVAIALQHAIFGAPGGQLLHALREVEQRASDRGGLAAIDPSSVSLAGVGWTLARWRRNLRGTRPSLTESQFRPDQSAARSARPPPMARRC